MFWPPVSLFEPGGTYLTRALPHTLLRLTPRDWLTPRACLTPRAWFTRHPRMAFWLTPAPGSLPGHGSQQLDELSALDVIAPEVEGPTGRITLVIADLEHWSKLWDTLAPSMNEVIRLYSTLLRQNMRKCRGMSARRAVTVVIVFPDSSALLFSL